MLRTFESYGDVAAATMGVGGGAVRNTAPALQHVATLWWMYDGVRVVGRQSNRT